MKYVDEVGSRLGMDVNNWPHQFTKEGRELQVGINQETQAPIFNVPMICIHCHVKYLNGKQARPPDPCPARNKNRELKRLLS